MSKLKKFLGRFLPVPAVTFHAKVHEMLQLIRETKENVTKIMLLLNKADKEATSRIHFDLPPPKIQPYYLISINR